MGGSRKFEMARAPNSEVRKATAATSDANFENQRSSSNLLIRCAAWNLKLLSRTCGNTDRSFKFAALDIPLPDCEIWPPQFIRLWHDATYDQSPYARGASKAARRLHCLPCPRPATVT